MLPLESSIIRIPVLQSNFNGGCNAYCFLVGGETGLYFILKITFSSWINGQLMYEAS